MHPIDRPVLWKREGEGIIHGPLERHEAGLILLGQRLDDVPPCPNILKECLCDHTTHQGEWLAEDELHLSQILPYLNNYFQITAEDMPWERVLDALLTLILSGIGTEQSE